MYCNVMYYKGQLGGYHGNAYTYQTKLPLKTGDKVIAPTMKEPRQRGIVTAVNVAKPKFPCKEITELDTDDQFELSDYAGSGVWG